MNQPLRILPPKEKTFWGFVRYLLGERRIEGGTAAQLRCLAKSTRWKVYEEKEDA